MKRIKLLNITLLIIGLLLALHLAILSGIIPYDQVCAGRIKSKEEMLRFETVSILINVMVLLVLFAKRRVLKKGKQNKMVDYLLKAIGAFFALNTIGNLFAESKVELILGSITTMSLSILFFSLSKKSDD